MSPAAPPPRAPGHHGGEAQPAYRHDPSTLQEIPAPLATLALGAASLSLALAPFHYMLRVLRWVDAPLTGLLFFACAWITLASRRRKEQALAGLLLALAGLAVSLLVLVLDRTHPWRT